MKIIAILIPINLVTYWFFFLFCRMNQKQEPYFYEAGGLATKNISGFSLQ